MQFYIQTNSSTNLANQQPQHQSPDQIPRFMTFTFNTKQFFRGLITNWFLYLLFHALLWFLIFAGLDQSLFYTIGLAAMFLLAFFVIQISLMNRYFERIQTRRDLAETFEIMRNNDATIILSQQTTKLEGNGFIKINQKAIKLASINKYYQLGGISHPFILYQQDKLFLIDYEIQFGLSSDDRAQVNLIVNNYRQNNKGIAHGKSKFDYAYQIKQFKCNNFTGHHNNDDSNKDKLRRLGYLLLTLGLLLPYMLIIHCYFVKKQAIKIKRYVSLQ